MHPLLRTAALLLAPLAAALPVQQATPPAAPAAPVPPAATTAAKHFVLITLDTVRADKLGCYGYFRDTTPNLDRFAAQCVRFERCLAPVANTTPSHASLLTGVYPHEHGILTNFFQLPAEEQAGRGLQTSPTLRTFAQVATALGARTGAFVAATPVKKTTGLQVGFTEWTEPPPREPRRVGAEVVADGLRFLAADDGRPSFAWLHFFDTHGPIKPPKTPPKRYLELYRTDPRLREWLETRGFPKEVGGEHVGTISTTEANNLYDGCLRFLDDQIGPLLDALSTPERKADTLVIVVGDHGHGLGQHGVLSHGPEWDEQFRVPLLVRAPGVAPAVVATPVSTIDVLPTAMAQVAALRDPAFAAQCRGRDVLSADLEARPLFGLSARSRGETLTVTTTRWKLKERTDGPVELYDLENDPWERTVVAELRKVLADEFDRQRKRRELHLLGAVDGGTGIDPAVLEELRKLGYADDGGAGKDDGG
jgi:arylsulfatase